MSWVLMASRIHQGWLSLGPWEKATGVFSLNSAAINSVPCWLIHLVYPPIMSDLTVLSWCWHIGWRGTARTQGKAGSRLWQRRFSSCPYSTDETSPKKGRDVPRSHSWWMMVQGFESDQSDSRIISYPEETNGSEIWGFWFLLGLLSSLGKGRYFNKTRSQLGSRSPLFVGIHLKSRPTKPKKPGP